MDFKDIIKYKLLNEATNSHSKTEQSFFYLIGSQFLLIFLFSSIEYITKFFSNVFNRCNEYFTKKMNTQMNKFDETMLLTNKNLNEDCVPLHKKHDKNIFKLKRIYLTEENDNKNKKDIEQSNMIVDAILLEISKLHNIPEFELIDNGKVLVTYKDKPIQITNEIYFMINSIIYSGDKLSHITISLLSNILTASEIIGYTMNLYEQYKITINNSLGSNIYFFDHKSKENNIPKMPFNSNGKQPNDDEIMAHKRMMISTASKNLTFTKTLFTSNKSFQNICGDDIRIIEKRVKFFINNKNWYDNKGIPYQLGILLSGVPGSGKTSVIRAIANLTKRHIINVNFGNITTATQLKSIFQSDILNVYKDNSLNDMVQYHIPIDKRLYVLEEIDAVSDIVKKRIFNDTRNVVPDELTLGEILTVLDGTMEIPGRMLIMTSNYPESLDDALIRPGRIDIQVKFGYCSKEIIQEIYKIYFDKEINQKLLDKIPENVFTPAEVGQIFFKYITSNDLNENEIIQSLIEQSKKLMNRIENEPILQLVFDECNIKKTDTIVEEKKEENVNDNYVNEISFKEEKENMNDNYVNENSYKEEKRLTIEYQKIKSQNNKKNYEELKSDFKGKVNLENDQNINWRDIKYIKPTDNFDKFFQMDIRSTEYDDMFK